MPNFEDENLPIKKLFRGRLIHMETKCNEKIRKRGSLTSLSTNREPKIIDPKESVIYYGSRGRGSKKSDGDKMKVGNFCQKESLQ